MYILGRISLILLTLIIPLALHGAEGYIGENPGFDFYSKIDEGNYKILEKTISRRLRETPTLDQFGKKCMQAEILLRGIPTTPALLDDLEKLNYSSFFDRVSENIRNNPSAGITLSTERFQNISLCLTDAYKELKDRAKSEQNARETIAYIGLYMDGDKSNSEYDIVSDIEKINMIIFSQDIPYSGTANQSGKGLSDFFSNRPIATLLSRSGATTSASTSLPPGTTTGSGRVSAGTNTVSATPTLNLASIIGDSCGNTSALGPIDTLMDTGFATELQAALQAGPGENIASVGYTPSVGQVGVSASGGASRSGALTSGSDFFHSMPCTSIFCVKTAMIPGSSNLLGGSKNVSIEGILDKHAAILYPLSESALGCQVMTNNAGSSPIKNLKLAKTMAGLKVYLGTKPQVTRRDKAEASPEREEEALKDIQNCGYASVGLTTDTARANSIGGAGFKGIRGTDMTNFNNTASPLGPQEVAELARYTDCIDSHIRTGRKGYYDSFSTDVTEIQAYTVGMLDEITSIMSTLTAMNSKPLECKQ